MATGFRIEINGDSTGKIQWSTSFASDEPQGKSDNDTQYIADIARELANSLRNLQKLH